MKKHQQKQLLDILKTIEQAQASELYADCQECAISIGEFIEEIEGEGTQTVTLLEEYCELLYKASLGEAGQKALSKQLLRSGTSIGANVSEAQQGQSKPDFTAKMYISLK